MKGQFNVPFGRQKNPKFLDEPALIAASELLQKTTIVCGDYKTVLREYAKPNDLIFLDPPYLPISAFADFKRYTKEQFYEEDHVELAAEVNRLHELGCHTILTNSNHPLVHEQYSKFVIEVIKTKRYISCHGNSRTGEDVIVTIPPKPRFNPNFLAIPLPAQALKYPSTRYMGSKNKLLSDIWRVASQFKFDNVIDLFSGSGIVGYMFKSHGKNVISNDYMALSAMFAKAMIENNKVLLTQDESISLLKPNKLNDHFVEKTFKDLYFTNEDNKLIDTIRCNIRAVKNPYKKAIAISALMRSCLKKRPRGIFTYIGNRYDDGRKDLTMTLRDQFIEAVNTINISVFDNGTQNQAKHGDAMLLKPKGRGLVYIDPPYYSPFSDNEYVRRYHFIEGLARDWQGVEIQEHTLTKKFKSYPTPFSSRKGAEDAFDLLFKKFKENIAAFVKSLPRNIKKVVDDLIAPRKEARK